MGFAHRAHKPWSLGELDSEQGGIKTRATQGTTDSPRSSRRDRAELEPSGNVRGGGSCWVKRRGCYRVTRIPSHVRNPRTPRQARGTLKPAAENLGRACKMTRLQLSLRNEQGLTDINQQRRGEHTELRDNLDYLTYSRQAGYWWGFRGVRKGKYKSKHARESHHRRRRRRPGS